MCVVALTQTNGQVLHVPFKDFWPRRPSIFGNTAPMTAFIFIADTQWQLLYLFFVCLFVLFWECSIMVETFRSLYKPSERMKTSFSVSLRLYSAGNQSVFMLPPIPRIICHLQSKGFLKVNLQPLPLSLSLSLNPPDALRLRSMQYWSTLSIAGQPD